MCGDAGDSQTQNQTHNKQGLMHTHTLCARTRMRARRANARTTWMVMSLSRCNLYVSRMLNTTRPSILASDVKTGGGGRAQRARGGGAQNAFACQFFAGSASAAGCGIARPAHKASCRAENVCCVSSSKSSPGIRKRRWLRSRSRSWSASENLIFRGRNYVLIGRKARRRRPVGRNPRVPGPGPPIGVRLGETRRER